MADNNRDSLTGLTENEAREFHGFFMQGFIGFTIIAIVAHILVWFWRPWFPGTKGYASLIDGATGILTQVSTLIG